MQEVHKVFDSLEFRVLRDRLFETLTSQEEIDDTGFEMTTRQLEAGPTVADWLDQHAARPMGGSGSRSRAPGAAGSGDVHALALATEAGAAYVDAAGVTPEDDAALAAWLADPHRPKVMHDAKGPMLALSARGWPVHGLARDRALSGLPLRPDQRSYDLADLTLRYLKRELKVGASDDGQLTLFDAVGDAQVGETAMLAARAVVRPGAGTRHRARRAWRHCA